MVGWKMSSAKRPNILFLMADQCQGRIFDRDHPCQTPNLDRLAKRGVRFCRAYTPNAVCSPARASLMTGLLPHNHGMLMVTHSNASDLLRLREDKPHWAQRLVAAGYHTGYFGKWHVEHSENPGAFGWQVSLPMDAATFPAQRSQAAPDFPLPGFCLEQPGYEPVDLYRVFDRDPAETRAARVCNLASDFLEQSFAGEAPWCCFLSLLEPHDPFYCGKAAYDLYRDVPISLPPDDDLSDRPGIYRRVARIFASLSPEQRREAIRCYYASITEIDAHFGKILNRLEAAGEMDNTIVVFTSDHGELLGAHGLYCKNFSAFEEVYRIPLLMAGPGITRIGEVSSARVGLHEVGLTLLEIAQARPLPPSSDGRAFSAALREPGADAGFVSGFAEYSGSRIFVTQRVYWENDWKYVFNGFDEDELYDLKSDPHELKNLITHPACSKTAKRLLSELWRRVVETGDHSLAKTNYPPYRLAAMDSMCPHPSGTEDPGSSNGFGVKLCGRVDRSLPEEPLVQLSSSLSKGKPNGVESLSKV